MNPTNSPLPAGWKIIPASSSQYLLQSPTGKVYPTYLAALRHLNYFDSNQTEIDILRIGLVQEGWEAQSGLPSKWFTKEENNQVIFLSQCRIFAGLLRLFLIYIKVKFSFYDILRYFRFLGWISFRF